MSIERTELRGFLYIVSKGAEKTLKEVKEIDVQIDRMLNSQRDQFKAQAKGALMEFQKHLPHVERVALGLKKGWIRKGEFVQAVSETERDKYEKKFSQLLKDMNDEKSAIEQAMREINLGQHGKFRMSEHMEEPLRQLANVSNEFASLLK